MLSVIFKKEINAFFNSTIGYMIIAVFLLATGLMLWVIPGQYNIIESGYANVDGLFELAPWLFLFLCPAITMRSIAEEKQHATWENLVAKPIGISRIVVGKFLASWTLVIIALVPTLIFYFSVRYIAEPLGNIDTGAFIGSFIGLIFLAALYVSIGIFASSLSKNQVLAFVLGITISFLMYYGFEMIALFFQQGMHISFLENLGVHFHYKSLSRGVLDSRDLIYFFVITASFLILSILKLKIKK